eukprot:758003-Hanusia_phi.AAC.6
MSTVYRNKGIDHLRRSRNSASLIRSRANAASRMLQTLTHAREVEAPEAPSASFRALRLLERVRPNLATRHALDVTPSNSPAGACPTGAIGRPRPPGAATPGPIPT